MITKITIFLFISLNCAAQYRPIEPPTREPYIKKVYTRGNKKATVYQLKDGDGYVIDSSGVAYYSKAYLKKWVKKNFNR